MRKQNRSPNRSRKPKLNDYDKELRGEPQNRFGGFETQNLNAYRGNTFGPAGDCRTFTAEERLEWAQRNGFE